MESCVRKYLLRYYSRPIFHEDCEQGSNALCMLDTGADVPVFVNGETEFKERFPSAVKEDKLVFTLSGFGTGVEVVPVYRIPIFEIRSDIDNTNSKLVFHNLRVACCTKDEFIADFILSKTMFMHTNIFIYNYGRDTRQLELQYVNNIFECSVRRNKVDDRLNSIYVIPVGNTDSISTDYSSLGVSDALQ